MSAELDALLASRKYRDLCPDTVRREYERALITHGKDASKAARTRLHQICSAFMSADELKRAGKHLAAHLEGDKEALSRTLLLHASTRERLGSMQKLYDEAFRLVGTPEMVLDLACGLNPLYLGNAGFRVRGCDIHGGMTALVNEWARACGWDVVVETADVLCTSEFPAAPLALMMKLLPVLDQQQKGAAARVLRTVRARHKLVTFPTRTLSGRRVGMMENYTERYEPVFAETNHAIAARFLAGDELCYILKEE